MQHGAGAAPADHLGRAAASPAEGLPPRPPTCPLVTLQDVAAAQRALGDRAGGDPSRSGLRASTERSRSCRWCRAPSRANRTRFRIRRQLPGRAPRKKAAASVAKVTPRALAVSKTVDVHSARFRPFPRRLRVCAAMNVRRIPGDHRSE